MDLDRFRSSYSLGLMCEAAKNEGLPIADSLAGTAVTPAMLDDPDAQVSPRQELAVVRNIVEKFESADELGLRIGRQFHVSLYGLFAFFAASCHDLRELLLHAQQFAHLSFWLLDIRFELQGDEQSVVIEDDHIPRGLRRFVVERDVMGMLTTGRQLFAGDPPLYRVELAVDTPIDAGRYTQAFGVPTVLNAPRNRFVLRRQHLATLLPQANPVVRRYWEKHLRPSWEQALSPQSAALLVRRQLAHSTAAVPSMEVLAARLCTTTRQLRRRLDAEGTSFRELLEDYRQTTAEDLLLRTDLSLSEIASRLGYREISSFTQAFKRWNGASPRKWQSAQDLR